MRTQVPLAALTDEQIRQADMISAIDPKRLGFWRMFRSPAMLARRSEYGAPSHELSALVVEIDSESETDLTTLSKQIAAVKGPITVLRDRVLVQSEGTSSPRIRVPVDQLDAVIAVLETNKVPYSLDHHIISMNGNPALALIHLGRTADLAQVQALLDAAE